MNRRASLIAAMGLLVLLAAILPARAEAPADPAAEVADLIAKLGHAQYDVREAATQRLIEIGVPAIPALREAAKHPDPEVATRVRQALNVLTGATPALRAEMRRQAREAFDRADYETMASLHTRLTFQDNPDRGDFLGLAHAHQLAGHWKEAVAAYRAVLDQVDARLEELGPMMKPAAANVAAGVVLGRSARGPAPAVRQRDQLLLLVGLIERDELGDLQAAAATFARTVERSDLLKRSVKELAADYEERLRRPAGATAKDGDPAPPEDLTCAVLCLEELAATQERLGRWTDALATRDRIVAAGRLSGVWAEERSVAAMGRVIQNLPADRPPPELATLIVLTPEEPGVSLDLAEARSQARAWRPTQGPGVPHWQFALSPPPGREFAALEVRCDVEQQRVVVGVGQFLCWASGGDRHPGRAVIGEVDWPKDEPPGRKTLERRFDVPPGAGLVYFGTGRREDVFAVRGVALKATFRPRSAPGVGPVAAFWMQSEVLPPGGRLTYDGKPVPPAEASPDFPPGRHVFACEVPGRKDAFRCEADFAPGAWYNLFVNLASPLAPRLTNLRRFGGGSANQGTLARLPDGRWLLAWSRDAKIVLSASRDLATWDEPWPLTLNSVFRNYAPSLAVDKDGVLWIAWFANRLNTDLLMWEGYRLWLASSRDGRTWTRPAPVAVDVDGNWPKPPVQFLRVAEGKYGMFWRTFAGSAESPGALRRLEPVAMARRDTQRSPNAFVAADSDGRMHMVFDHFGEGIFYSRSDDGTAWTPPALVVAKSGEETLRDPQLIVRGRRAALLYETDAGGWLCRGTVDGPPKFGPATKIAGRDAPIGGARLTVTPEGRVALLAGADTVWLLEGDLKKVLGADD